MLTAVTATFPPAWSHIKCPNKSKGLYLWCNEKKCIVNCIVEEHTQSWPSTQSHASPLLFYFLRNSVYRISIRRFRTVGYISFRLSDWFVRGGLVFFLIIVRFCFVAVNVVVKNYDIENGGSYDSIITWYKPLDISVVKYLPYLNV